jgi:tRNA1Val (adenine37-N6)-methyltransferase
MSNPFHFKQFTILQDKSAMKVCTDSCLFGAHIANSIHFRTKKIKNILDIGTGTGLLPLMLIQKNNIPITGVEIDLDSYIQASENVTATNWSNQIHLVQEDIKTWNPKAQFDFIISNPPFFENDLHSLETKKNQAKHNTTLTYKELLTSITRLLNLDGQFAVLIPFSRSNYFIQEAATQNFYLTEQIFVKQTPKHPNFRSILYFGREEKRVETHTIIIKDNNNQYTNEFIALLKDYYLHL